MFYRLGATQFGRTPIQQSIGDCIGFGNFGPDDRVITRNKNETIIVGRGLVPHVREKRNAAHGFDNDDATRGLL